MTNATFPFPKSGDNDAQLWSPEEVQVALAPAGDLFPGGAGERGWGAPVRDLGREWG